MTEHTQLAPREDGRREPLRSLKRLARLGLAPDAPPEVRQQSQRAALALLKRSILFGHHRLAVRRLLEAVALGASVAPDQWAYCERAAFVAADPALKARLGDQKRQAAGAAVPPALPQS